MFKTICLAISALLIINFYLIEAENNIFLLSVPKSGTHLIQKCFNLINKELNIIPNVKVPIVHAGYYIENEQYLKSLIKSFNYLFLMIRDPRDQIISYINNIFGLSVINQKGITFKKQNPTVNSKNLSFNEILLCSICFGSWYKYCNKANNCDGIYGFFKPYLNFLKNSEYNFCLIKFENLVGPKGGGTFDLQFKEISKICNYLKIEAKHENIKNIANNLFGETATFRQGQIGSWKNCFNPIHKICFKKIAGQLLIDLGYENDLNW